MSCRICVQVCFVVAAAVMSLSVLSANAASTRSTDDRPNILFLLSDDQQWNALGAAGNAVVQTPSIDALAARGMRFTRTFCMGSWSGAVCLPSRAMMMSGQTLWRVNGQLNETPILPEVLKNNGYDTFGCGKWHNGKQSFVRGFTHGGHVFFGGMSNHLKVPVYRFHPDGKYPDSARFVGEMFSSEMFADDVIEFLESRGESDKPFFAYVAFTAPHDPRMAPKAYADRYDPKAIPLPKNFMPEHPFDNGELKIRDEMLAGFPRTPDEVRKHIAAYYAMITHLDAQIGRVLETLDRQGLVENTIIVYASDHGLAVGQHGLMGKQNMYDHSVRAPLIFAGPGIPHGRESHALMYLLDIAPTLLDYAGVDAPRTMEGASAKSINDGKQSSAREVVYGAYKQVQRMVRTDRWKLIRYTVGESTRWQLFDIENDPLELHDLAADSSYQDVFNRMRVRLAEQMWLLGDQAVQRE